MKILYVTTISNTVNAFLIPHIKMLVEQGHQVDVAFNIVQEVDSELIKFGCNIHQLDFNRLPLNSKNYLAYKKLKRIIQNEKYDIVHTHTPVASACVRLACRNLNNVRVMYTAHGFHFYKGAPIQNWLIYFSIEKWLSKYTDILITINQEDFQRAKKLFKARLIEYLPGVGIDIDKFNKVAVDKVKKRYELNLPKDAFVVLSVGELNKNKNHKAIIEAIAQLKNPNIYYVICGQGPLEKYLKDLTNKLGISNWVRFLGFRIDIAEICKVSDVFAFPSFREGLGMAALEAMSTGLPIITSNKHGIIDYSKNEVSGYVMEPSDINGFAEAINNLFSNIGLRRKISKNNIEFVKHYEVNNSLEKLKQIYTSI